MEMSEVRFGFPNRPEFLGPVSGVIEAGCLCGIIGPNGAGKSTLLKLCAAILKPSGGALRLAGRELHAWPRQERGQRMAYVPQRVITPPNLTVRDTVLLGRFPHRGTSIFETPHDHEIAVRAMALTEVLPLADRFLGTLSGGEAQCVHLAAAVAQEPALLLLDEPTSALDLYHQHLIYEKLRELTLDRKLAVAVVTHDLNLASRYCDHLWLMHGGKVIASGAPRQIMKRELLQEIYHVTLSMPQSAEGEMPWIIAQSRLRGSTN